MRRTWCWWMVWVAVTAMGPGGIAKAQVARNDLGLLVTRLGLSDHGIRTWLKRLEGESGSAGERLLVLNASGEQLAERSGGATAVVLGREMDDLLRTPAAGLVLVHNPPASIGLSDADLSQLAKPGVAAIVAIGHDGSVYIAAAGDSMKRDTMEPPEYAEAVREVRERLRYEWSWGRLAPEDG